MSEFSSFAISFCGVCVATGGIHMLIPEGKMTKTVKYVIVLTLISALIGVFAVNFNFEFQTGAASDLDAEYRDEKLVTAVFENALNMNNVKFEKIVIFTDKSKEGSITITKIQIYSAESRERIMSAIGNGNEYEVEIIE